MNYTGWLGYPGHKHDRPHDPAATASFNQRVFEQEQKKAAAVARANGKARA